MEVFPAHLDRKFVKIIKIITVFGFPILGPILGPIFPLWALSHAIVGTCAYVPGIVRLGFIPEGLAAHSAA